MPTLGVGALCMTAAVILFLLQSTGYFNEFIFSTPETGTAFNVSSIVQPGTPLAASTATAPSSPVARLIIKSIGVDAKVVVKGVGADGYMETPNNAYDVAWYDFASAPGGGGNVIFSGHVDYRGVGPAVFWSLGKLQESDLVEVDLEDGSKYEYRITGKGAFDEATAPIQQIIGPTPVESVTLITCTGVFHSSNHQYDQRLVVRGERVGAAPSASTGLRP